MKPLDLNTLPLSGSNLIEASAGTGKTYTIAALYLRLLLEQPLGVESILVVTFTTAATAELRERIRTRLVEAEQAFSSGSSGDPLLIHLLATLPEREQALRRLRQGLLLFDRAAIFTIHGFCQRLLGDHAYESGTLFTQQVITDSSSLRQAVADDFWRCQVQNLLPPLVEQLLAQRLTPEQLHHDLQRLLGRPYLQFVGGEEMPPLESLHNDYQQQLAQFFAQWQRESEALKELLSTTSALSRTSYKPDRIDTLLKQISAWLAQPQPQLPALAELLTAAKLQTATKKGHKTPTHPLVDAWDKLLHHQGNWQQAAAQSRIALTRRALEWFNQELPLRKQQLGVIAFDDMLLQVAAALHGSHGPALTRRIGERYQAALIDEFQDTDPLQYQIFHHLFAGEAHHLFLVGDPKQAIYSFRGADIFAYLHAHKDISELYTLHHNWRSTPEIITACNALFSRTPHPFVLPEIPFLQVTSGGQPPPPLSDPERPELRPLHCWLLTPDEEGKEWGKTAARERIAATVADEIARLLHAAANGQALLGEQPLQAGDIAVLVRSHRQGELVAEQLRQRQIGCVQHSQIRVFASAEAEQLEQLLRSLATPGDEGLLRNALVTPLLGYDANALESPQPPLEELLEQWQVLHQLWSERGIYPLLRRLLVEWKIEQRLLGYRDGERRLTNLYHLIELLNGEERSNHPGSSGLVQWLAWQRSTGSEQEESQLRLESDAHLVQIVTIHKSKGLEYPVVFCPFLWDGKLSQLTPPQPISYHHENQAMVDLGSDHYPQAQIAANREELAENLRLLYVAITRARQRCYLAWGAISSSGASPLGYLLHPWKPPSDHNWAKAAEKRLAALSLEELKAPLQQLAADHPEAFSFTVLAPEDDPEQPETTAPARRESCATLRSAHTLNRSLESQQRLTSFTALVNASRFSDSERPDHDQLTRDLPAAAPLAEPFSDIADFPRGATAGSCLHHLLEQVEFVTVTATSDPQSLHALAQRTLERFGIDPAWSGAVVGMVQQLLTTPLDGHQLRLNQIPRERRKVEMEFYCTTPTLTPYALRKLCRDHWPALPAPYREALERLRLGELRGLLHGFIDLIIAFEGRYYLLDYKSNHLGSQPAAYTAAAMTAEIAHHGYFVQYLLYSLALHRYLQQRLPDYHYEQHFGGVYYLFIRGVAQHGDELRGVYYRRLPYALVEALSRQGGDSRG